jgi:AcrR family transcriptional regulator
MTKEDILIASRRIFARKGYDGLGMRILASELDCALSVLYHHFENKDQLLKSMFDWTSSSLGEDRANLPITDSANKMLEQRIEFQFDHIEQVVAVLKYYFHFRDTFSEIEDGILPSKAYHHMLEVVERGNTTGEFKVAQPEQAARILTHCVNGFLLEYYPKRLAGTERTVLVDEIASFLVRAL